MTMMWVIPFVFSAMSATLIAAAAMVVLSKNPVHSALFLVLAFFASAGLWLLLEAEFLALLLMLVYVGAVMTLFLFVVMTLNPDSMPVSKNFMRYLPLCLLIVSLLIGLIIHAMSQGYFNGAAYQHAVPLAANASNTEALGLVLYTQFAYPFEIAGVLLLVAIIAAVSLTVPIERKRKVQMAEQQMAAQPRDRVRLVKMPLEKKS